jgi:YYY domain-containing protein
MLPVISWWLALQLLGLAALPLTWRVFARLPGRAYPFAKPLGLLLTAYILWLGAIFRVLPNTLGGIILALLMVAAISALVGRAAFRRDEAGRRPLVDWLAANKGLIFATELLFLVVFALWAVFRAYNPDIAGTEKPMEFAFINGVLGSRLFPPQDPWLSGYGISYYYFGYVMLAALTRLTGVLPEVGFNLGVALWYALVMISAFGVVYTLVALARRPDPSTSSRRVATDSAQDASSEDHVGQGILSEATEGSAVKGAARRAPIGWGLLGALMLGFMANLQGLIDTAYQRSLLPLNIIQWFNLKDLTDTPPTGAWTGGFWWWWRASRVIHDQTLPVNGTRNTVEVIDEFPMFSFLLGDMHPHVLALPFVLLAVMFCLNLLAGALAPEAHREERAGFWNSLGERVKRLSGATGLSWGGLILTALVLGSLAFLNTWDFPIYVLLAALAFGGGVALREGLTWRAVGGAVVAFVTLAALGYLLYAPFYVGFQSQLGGILPNLLFPSRFSQFFLMFGPFLVAVVFFLGLLCHEWGSRRTTRHTLFALPFTLLLPVLAVALLALTFFVTPGGRAAVQQVLQQPEVAANVGTPTAGGLIALAAQVRAGSPWTWLALAVLLAWAIGAAVTMLARRAKDGGLATECAEKTEAISPKVPVDLFALLMIVVALALTLFPEFLYLRDLFGTRMNTVFKFYYQAWALLALASAYGLSRLAMRTTPVALKVPALILSGLLILGGLWYPVAAIPSKADNFAGQPTLDGLAYLQRSNPADVAAIEWLRVNVPRSAVVLEASGGSYSPEGAGRVSMSTGNPTLLGWDFHQRQWRGNDGYDKLAAMRPGVIDQIYRLAQPGELTGLLDLWNVDYVYVGELERNKYGVSDAALARFDAVLNKVYDADGVRIYAR